MVEQEGPRLYNRVRRIVQFHDDADDVMQNTFLKAWMALDTFRAESKVSTWLHRIAINECLTLLGKRRPMQSLDGEAEELSAEIKNLEGDTYFDGDAAQLKALLSQILSTDEGKALAEKLSRFGNGK